MRSRVSATSFSNALARSFGPGMPTLPSSDIGARPAPGSTVCSVATR